jgi:hypothetical protein
MSSTFDRRSGARDLSYYAQRQAPQKLRPARVSAPTTPQSEAKRDADWEANARTNAHHDALESERWPERSVFHSALDLIWRPAIAVAIVTGLGFLALALSMPKGTTDANNGVERMKTLQARPAALTENEARLTQPAAVELSIAPVTPAPRNEPIPLVISAQSLNDGGLVIVSGLPQGATLSAGKATGDNWWLSSADLQDLKVLPAADFVGAMEVAIELRLPDAHSVARKTVRLEWIDANPAQANESDGASSSPATAPSFAASAQTVKNGEIGADPMGRRALRPGADFTGPALAPAERAEQAQPVAEERPVSNPRSDAASQVAEAEPKAANESQGGRVANCFAKIDGKVVTNGRCKVLEGQQGVSFETADGLLSMRHNHGRVWGMTWDGRDFGKVFKRDSCWGSDRVYVCEHRR